MTVGLQVCLAWVLLGTVVPAAAQQPGAVAGIRGRVIDPQRRGVEARVQSTVNYSGFANALVRDSNDPTNSGYLRSSQFGTPVRTAGGVFGSGGPFALQLGVRVSF